jgi:hypothetical protein
MDVIAPRKRIVGKSDLSGLAKSCPSSRLNAGPVGMMNFSWTSVPIKEGEVMIFWRGKVPATAPN